MSVVDASLDVSPEREAWATEPSSSGLQPALSDQPPLCVDCPKKTRRPATSSCLECDRAYCDACWADRAPHKRGDSGHERVPMRESPMEDLTPIFRRLDQVFYKDTTTAPEENQQRQNDQQHKQHHHVLETLWLAVASSDDTHGSPLLFNERPRFGDLMGEHRKKVKLQPGNRNITYYPRLISFVGNTGAGKSSLIEVLIGHLWDSRITDRDLHGILVPVAGNSTNTLPTSSDIHLYHDPIEAKTNPESPLLFADCEGFGAANHSAAANSRAKSMKNIGKEAPDDVRQDATKLRAWTRNAFDTSMRFIERTLNWLDSNTDRSKAVAELFPKLVYNISDVVVYVVAETNLKSMGKILEKLVEWSQKAELSSVNRTSLPSLIILVNQCDPVKTEEWGSDEATDQILKENAYLMERNVTIRSRKEELAKFGLPHKSIKEILDNSYAAVKFLRLPTAKDTSRLRSQFQELYAMIDSLTKATHNSRRENNMLLSPEQLHHLYRLTFDHFSQSATSPFDFMEAFFTVHPSPAELSGNFFELLQATFDAVKHGNQTSSHGPFADKLIAAAVPMICSTIAVDSRRRQFPGLLSDIFRSDTSELPPSNLEARDGSYENTVQRALRKFADSTLPCGYTFSSSTGETKICVNGMKAHIHQSPKGYHQDANGVRFGSGSFDPSIQESFEDKWGHALVNGLSILDTKRLPSLWVLHRKAIRDLHDLVPEVNLQRLPSCVWCMRNFPTEKLPCGHWICSSCVVGIGRRREHDDRVSIVELCDRHSGGGEKLNPPLEFLDLPKTVGRRLLSLDEGGVRGILQLELLAAVQDKLGKEIPVQHCFDLIGGTGIGGINALGLGISRLDVSKAIEEFNRLVPGAFVKQDPRFLDVILWRQKAPYSLDGLIRSIQNVIGQDSELPMTTSLSHGIETGSGPIRVFVTSTRKGSGRMLLTNYRRQAVDINQDQGQDLKQSQKNRESPKYAEIYSVGEAAKATASFEPFFGPCTLGNHLHVGGGQEFACPAEATLLEAQSLWPHMLGGRPDVLVSVGCGHKGPATSGNSKDCTGTGAMWSEAFGERSQKEPDRYIRLCPEFSNEFPLPNADDVSVLRNRSLLGGASALLRDGQEKTPNQEDLRGKIDQVARRLISTIFYFDKTSSESCKEGGWIIYGFIQCRFKETSKITKAFGIKISSFKNPRFVCGSEDLWSFDEYVLKLMTEQGRFRAPQDTESFLEIRAQSEDKINIKFMADDFPSESISGSSPSQELVPGDEENPQAADISAAEYFTV